MDILNLEEPIDDYEKYRDSLNEEVDAYNAERTDDAPLPDYDDDHYR